jgi:hypothetical protein
MELSQRSRQWPAMKRGLGVRLALLAAIFAAPILPQPLINTDFFPYSGGWLGADAAYSIPLDSTTTVWLFGDTFVGQHRAASAMIHNSIAIRKCKGTCELTYWWSAMHTAKPDGFFKTPESNYFWPLDGFTYEGRLYVFLEQMHALREGGAFGFDYSSIKLATISNPKEDPDRWVISYRSISEGNRVVPGIATAIPAEPGEGYGHVFTLFRRSAPEPFVGLMRFALIDLPANKNGIHWQYLSKDKHWLDWTPSTSPDNAWNAFKGNVTEMSVKYHPESHSWLAIFPTPGFLSKTASYVYSRDLSGPWSNPRPFFSYSEMQKNDSRYTPSIFCYAAKEHPELESTGNLVFSYACNSQKETEIFTDMRLYRPEVESESFPIDLTQEKAKFPFKQ